MGHSIRLVKNAVCQSMARFARQALRLAQFRAHLPRLLVKSSPYLLISAISVAVLHKVLFSSGLIMYGDLMFPFPVDRFLDHIYPLWTPYGSLTTIGRTALLPFEAPVAAISAALNVSVETIIKAHLLGILILIGSSMYFAASSLLRERGKSPRVVFIASMTAALVYMFNPWSLSQISHIWLWLGYALTPLVLLCFMRALKTHRLRYIVLTAVLLCLASGHVRWVIALGILMVGWLVFWLLSRLGSVTRREVLNSFGVTSLVLMFYVLFSAFWLLPWLTTGFNTGNVAPPTFLIVDQAIDSSSWNASLDNVFRLMGCSWVEIPWQPTSSWMHELWFVASFTLPLLAFSALFIRRSRYPLYFASMGLLFAFLTKGTQSPLGSSYKWLVFDIPFLSDQLGRLFRAPYWWGGALALCLCFLIALAVAEILHWGWREKGSIARKSAPFVVLLLFLPSFALFVQQPARGFFGEIYVPVEVPQEYNSVNNWLGEQEGDFKVSWIPSYDWRDTTWGSHVTGSVASFDVWSSSKPTMADCGGNPDVMYYYNYTYRVSLLGGRTAHYGKYMEPINTRYVLYHSDIVGAEGENNAALANLEQQQDMMFVGQDGFYSIFENEHYAPHIFIPAQNLLVAGGFETLSSLNALEAFDPERSSLLYLDQTTGRFYPQAEGIVLGAESSIEDIALSQVDERYLVAPFQFTHSWDPGNVWSKGNIQSYWGQCLNWFGAPACWDFDYKEGFALTCDYRSNLETVAPHPIGTGDAAQWQAVAWSENDHISVGSDGHSLALDYTFDNQDSQQVVAQNLNAFDLEGWSNYDTFSAWVYGDGSGNALQFWYRINNDESRSWGIGECTLDWTGWERVSLAFPTEARDRVHRLALIVNWNQNRSQSGLGSHRVIVAGIELSQVKTVPRHRLVMPVEVDQRGRYVLYARVLKSPRGGTLTIAIDGEEVGSLNTMADNSMLIWEWVGSGSLGEGNHYITLENSFGLNAVNLLALMPEDAAQGYFDSAQDFLHQKRIVHLLEGERDLDYQNGEVSNSWGLEASGGQVLVLKGLASAFVPPFSIDTGDLDRWQAVAWTASDRIQIGSDGGTLTLNYTFDDQNSAQVVADNYFLRQDWSDYDTFSAWVYGDGSGNALQFWYRMNNDESRSWGIGECTLDWTGWKQVSLPLTSAQEPRDNVTDLRVVVNWNQNRSQGGLGSHTIQVKDIRLSLEHSSEATIKLHILRDSSYRFALRVMTGPDCGSIALEVDGKRSEIDLHNDEQKPMWVYSEPVSLDKGEHTLWILPETRGETQIDSVAIYSTEDDETLKDVFEAGEDPPVISWQEISPTKYTVHVTTQTPFMLAFAEAYDPMWVARVDGKEYRSRPLYSVINGFWIDETGELEITIEYKPQRWFHQGAAISIGSFVLALGLIAGDWRWRKWRNR